MTNQHLRVSMPLENSFVYVFRFPFHIYNMNLVNKKLVKGIRPNLLYGSSMWGDGGPARTPHTKLVGVEPPLSR